MNPTQSTDVRADLANRFPACLQPIITHITGKAYHGQVPPSLVFSPSALFLVDFSTLWAAMLLLFWISCHCDLPLFLVMYPILVVAIVGRLRQFQVAHAHHSVHKNEHASGKGLVTTVSMMLATIFPIVQNERDYREDHLKHHKKKIFTTHDDPDAAFLYDLGFRPGLSVPELWQVLGLTLVSPRFHWIFAKSRISSNLRGSIPRRMAFCFWIAVLVVVAQKMGLVKFLVVVVLPFGPFYHISALLQFLTEHAWMKTGNSAPQTKEEYASRCWARFCGEPLPRKDLDGPALVIAWINWTLKMVFIHIPVRFGVLVGDLTCHDWHHLSGHESDEWPNFPYAREAAVRSGKMPDNEIWGLGNAINHVFEVISAGQ